MQIKPIHATATIQSMSREAVQAVANLESAALEMPQVPLATSQTLHAGVYSRTVVIPAGVMITGALIKIATTLIVSGSARVFTGQDVREFCGYHVLQAQPNRKQVFLALTETRLTMLFATQAATIKEAESEFTDEADMLQTNRTGAIPCPA